MSGSRRWLTTAKVALVACGAATAAVVMTGALASPRQPAPPAPATSPGPTPAAAAAAAAAKGSVVRILPGTSLSSVRVKAGTTYEFAAGAQYTGTLDVSADDVTVQSYGSGSAPVLTRHAQGSDIVVSGTGDTVRSLQVTGQGYDGKNGYIIGVGVTGRDDTITQISAYGDLYAGVYFEQASSAGTVSHSIIDHCDALNPQHLSSGAFGVLLWGTRNTVEDNTIKNQVTTSPVYGTDGSAVEVYHGRDNIIRDNTGSNDTAFTELGGAGATGNSYIGNTFTGPGDFLITRGSGDKVNGPVLNTIVTRNRADGEIVSYDWRPGNGTLLTLAGNTITMPGKIALWTDGGYVNDGGNTFTGKIIKSGH
ncbi:MAG TPA: hypothetical protein VGH27_30945 [Streptosporangiaceae bacterium]|jgi:hypothetical protein